MLDLANFVYLALQRGVGADVLEETWLIVDPQLLLLLLALLVVLVQLAHLREKQITFPFFEKFQVHTPWSGSSSLAASPLKVKRFESREAIPGLDRK